jgi:hypothetical protein
MSLRYPEGAGRVNLQDFDRKTGIQGNNYFPLIFLKIPDILLSCQKIKKISTD